MHSQIQLLINAGKTFYHPDTRAEWLIWQLALALEKALEEINELEQQHKNSLPTAHPEGLY